MRKEPELPQPYVEHLTRREREILALLADNSLSARDIADHLTIALTSVKWYIRQIYAKLGVNSRREALKCAAELGLLKSAATGASPIGNLPATLTQFIGRENEVVQVRQILQSPGARLVTLTGVGGVGKTRLALRVAELVQGQYPQGAWLVELAALNDGNRTVEAIAAVFGLLENKGKDTLAFLQEHLRSKKLLLILDNCEHLIEDCAKAAETLLRACPKLQVLVTSREILGIGGEIIFRVPPLSVPETVQGLSVDELMQADSVRLFCERARQFRPGFGMAEGGGSNSGPAFAAADAETNTAIFRICRQMDGIPLALELAAARLNVLNVEQIADLLEENTQLLSGGSRTALPRQQTMQASIDWSYNLLTSAEQVFIREVSVLVGGWTIEAAAAVTTAAGTAAVVSDPSPKEKMEVIETLAQLIDKSFVVVIRQDQQPPRYRMLEPIRQHLHARLIEAGEEPAVLNRVVTYYLRLAEQAGLGLRGREQSAWLERLEREIDNFRLALRWALKSDPEIEVRLAAELRWFWHMRGRWSEGLEWLMNGLNAMPANAGTPALAGASEITRANGLAAAGYLRSDQLILQSDSREYESTAALLKESLAIYRKQSFKNRGGAAFSLLQLARCAASYLNNAQVVSWAMQSLALYQGIGDSFGISESLLILADNEPNTARAKDALEETLRIKESLGDENGIALALRFLSELAVYEGDYSRAETSLTKSFDYYHSTSNRRNMAACLRKQAWLAWVTGSADRAYHFIEKALAINREMQDPASCADHLLLNSEIAVSQGSYAAAIEYAREAWFKGREADNRRVIAQTLIVQGKIAWLEGDTRQAKIQLKEAQRISMEIRHPVCLAGALDCLGKILLSDGAPGSAKPLLKQSLKIYYETRFWHYWHFLAYPMAGLAGALAQDGEYQKAAQLIGAACARFPLMKNTLAPAECERYEARLATVQKTLGDVLHQRYWQEGQAMSVGQAVESGYNC